MKSKGTIEQGILDALLEALPMDVTIIDQEDRVIAWNESRTLFRIGAEVMGNDVRSCHPQKSMPELDRLLDEMKAGSLDTTRYVKQVKKGGRPRSFMIQYTALRDPEGRYLGCVELDMDITELLKEQ
jgi:hypothetical protein